MCSPVHVDSTYREIGGCHNCEHVFVRGEFEEADRHYCTMDAPERPICMSMCMTGEYFDPTSLGFDEYDAGLEKWRMHYADWTKWNRGREVHAWGWCQQWNEKTGESK